MKIILGSLVIMNIACAMQNNPLKLDAQSIKELKGGIAFALKVAKDIPFYDENKLVQLYLQKNTQYSVAETHEQLFDGQDQEKIDQLFRDVSQEATYRDAFAAAISSHNDEKVWDNFRKTSARLTMQKMTSKGFSYPKEYTAEKFSEYLQLNKNLTLTQGQWLPAGLAVLFYARQIQRMASGINPAMPVHK